MKKGNAKIEHRTSNVQYRSEEMATARALPFNVRHWMLDVGCSYFLLLLIVAFATGIAKAEDPGISVSGSATVKAKPTEIDITGTISGEGELANDASVKFRDAKKKALGAIDNLKNADLSVESDGSDVHDSVDPQQQMRIMQGQSTETPKVRTQITEHLKLKLKNADKLDPDKLLDTVLKLVDTCRDAGLTIGSVPTNYYQYQMQQNNGTASNDSLVQFKIPDTTELQNEACKQAIADARAKAQRIADMTGVKLGKVLSVHDYSTTTDINSNNNNQNGSDHPADKEAVSSTIGDIPVTVHVQVLFEIEK